MKCIKVDLVVCRADGQPATNKDVDQLAEALMEAIEAIGFEIGGSMGLVKDPDKGGSNV